MDGFHLTGLSSVFMLLLLPCDLSCIISQAYRLESQATDYDLPGLFRLFTILDAITYDAC
jgi:hypothetical protein